MTRAIGTNEGARPAPRPPEIERRAQNAEARKSHEMQTKCEQRRDHAETRAHVHENDKTYACSYDARAAAAVAQHVHARARHEMR